MPALVIPGCAHWVAEETPEETLAACRDSHQSRGNFASRPELTIILVYDSAALV